jgi:hypothetical protein
MLPGGLSTFRFQKVCRSRSHRVSINQSAQLERIHPGSWADTTILTPVHRCAGECRFVRVTGVLDASRTRTCVAFVLGPETSTTRAYATRTWVSLQLRQGRVVRPRYTTEGTMFADDPETIPPPAGAVAGA